MIPIDRRSLGLVLNALIRVALVVALAEVLTAPGDDPRFAGKGMGLRSLIVVGALSLTVPGVWVLRGRANPYPVWMDNLFLSILGLDLFGNVLDLYDRYQYFDLVPHAHGTGALTILAAWLLKLSLLGATAIATVGHILLEVQEYLWDVYFGTRNVRGVGDVLGDLVAGVIGSIGYAAVYRRFVRSPGREPPSLLPRRQGTTQG